MIHLDFRDARPIYSQIFDNFRLQISAGVLQPGEKLPSVRELAAQLAINPNTIQRSYRELESSGWTVSIPGKGNFVCEPPEGTGKEKQKLLEEFDQAAKKLLSLGISVRELQARIGGGENA